MNTTDLGRLGEVKVSARLVELGWYVFTDISGKCPVDLVAWKDGKTITIQVKSTNTVSPLGYTVEIGKSRPNRTTNIITKFNQEDADYLAAYLYPIDTVCFIKSTDVHSGRSITFGPEEKNLSKGKILLIDGHKDISADVIT